MCHGAGPFRGEMTLSTWGVVIGCPLEPHPRCGTPGISPGSFYGMGHLYGLTLPPWWSQWCCMPPCQKWISSLYSLGVLWYDCADKWGMGLWGVSLSLSPNVLNDSPINSFTQFTWRHFSWYITPLYWKMVSLSFGATSKVWMVSLPLKWSCISEVLHVFLNLLLSPLV